MQVILARPRGFCAGAVRAIDVVEIALEMYGPPVYVLHEIVHNHRVVVDPTRRGARFVETLDQVPPGTVLILSAHGVSAAVARAAPEVLVQEVLAALEPVMNLRPR
jgi:4-hydroxy-3-methylbut-2-enyl diphosphate reductase